MALKRVFQTDSDFQERMFAKQIAVMKGQAWNVVEALKTPDHGPLELTRRTKVCVWDDLVDVPVAVPMREASSELRRDADLRQSMDEQDIASSAPANQARVNDLLGTANSPADMPHPGRFELSASPTGEEAQSPGESSFNGPEPFLSLSNSVVPSSTTRPRGMPKEHTASYHGQSMNIYDSTRQQRQQRRFSFAPSPGRRSFSSIAQHLYRDDAADDDVDGDLGYAAAEGQMGNQRKVIVERLEAVKTKNPVFTWC